MARLATNLWFDGRLQLPLEQPFPVEAAEPFVLHHCTRASRRLAQSLTLVDLQELPDDVLHRLLCGVRFSKSQRTP